MKNKIYCGFKILSVCCFMFALSGCGTPPTGAGAGTTELIKAIPKIFN